MANIRTVAFSCSFTNSPSQSHLVSPARCCASGNARNDQASDGANGAEREARAAARRDLSKLSVPPFESKLEAHVLPHRSCKTLQINIGLTCNLACKHCHVESSPSRTETMSKAVADRIIQLTREEPRIQAVDITGGAPEMHEQFRYLVRSFRSQGLHVMDRCNLAVLGMLGQEDLANFLADNQVKVVASLPCYTPDNVEKQRGSGVFDSSIQALLSLNELGYGVPGSQLELDLVYNPIGAALPPPQRKLEEDYRRELRRVFGIQFTNLICITNMPIKRFADDLRRSNKLQEYLNLLVSNFNGDTIDSVMCRDMLHVAHDGTLYDCDFNYALDLGISHPSSIRRGDGTSRRTRSKPSVFDISSWAEIIGRPIRTGPHCYGCTAGSGSSCGGSLI